MTYAKAHRPITHNIISSRYSYNSQINSAFTSEAYDKATHESQNSGSDNYKIEMFKISDFYEQIIYVGVISSAESKSIFKLSLLFHCHFGCFCQILF